MAKCGDGGLVRSKFDSPRPVKVYNVAYVIMLDFFEIVPLCQIGFAVAAKMLGA